VLVPPCATSAGVATNLTIWTVGTMTVTC